MIRQRFLYVGIGGSGLDIGRELTEAITREICGLDGRRLQARGGAFAGFDRNQLPKFVQSVYLDFSQQALDEINTHLKGKNATAIHTILPPFNSFRDAATYLRNQNVKQVHEWIPDDATVNVAPLSAGAGQYPTVGRTALFASLKKQGYAQSLGKDLGRALDELAQSIGQLTAFAGDLHTDSIAVYLGFSLAGGTGCGIFYDVIHLLYHELTSRFPTVPCTIMPVVIMPSLFDEKLVGTNKRNTQLNAATALLDLSRLMDLFNNPDPELAALRRIEYPTTSVGGAGQDLTVNLDTQFGKTAVKVATLVDRRGGLRREDVYRSIASAIVSQISTVATVNQMTMGFVDKLVNDNEIRDMHHTLLGRKNIMPSVSASLTLPSARLVEVISQRLLADGLSAQYAAAPSRLPAENHVNSFLSGSGQGQIVEPNRFSEKVQITFATSAGALSDSRKFDQFQNNLQKKAQQSLDELAQYVRQEIPEIRDVRCIEGLIGVLDSHEDRVLHDALQIGSRGLQDLSGRRPTDDAPAAGNRKPRTPKRFGLFKGKPQKAEADRWVAAREDEYVKDVRELWWKEWAAKKNLWQSSVEDADRLIGDIRQWLTDQSDAANKAQQEELRKLTNTTLGVVDYLPSVTGNMEQTLVTLINGVKAKIRERLAIAASDDATLLAKIMRANQRNHWADALRTYSREKDRKMFVEQLLEPVRVQVQEVLQDVLTPLSDSLSRLANAQSSSLTPDLDQLQAKLASLLPDGVIPQVLGAKPRVLVTYPGREDQKVVDYLKKIVFPNRFDGFNSDEVYQFSAAGDTGNITATINIVGQGLLDSEEVRTLLATWVEANRPGVQHPTTDRLSFRQRLSFRNLQDITDVPNRRLILRNFLAALYDGHVAVTKGSARDPREIRITKPDTAAHLDIPLIPRDGASSWASLFHGFEEKIVTASTLVNPGLPDAIRWFGEYVPSCLQLVGNTPQAPSQLFEDIISIAIEQQNSPDRDEDLIGLNADARLRRESIRKFWISDVIDGLTAPYLNAPNTSFWCIGAPYTRTGQSDAMKDQVSRLIINRDSAIQKMIETEKQRRIANLVGQA